MNEITTRTAQLPDTLEDLTQFVLVGKAKLQAYMLKLQTVNKLSTAQEIRDQTLKEAQEISTALIAAEQRIGELLLAIPKQAGGDRRSEEFKNPDGRNFEKTKSETISEMGYDRHEASDFQRMAQNPEIVEKVIQTAIDEGRVVTKTEVMREIRNLKEQMTNKEKRIIELESREPEVRVERPADYEQLKKKAKEADAWKADFEKEKQKRNQDLHEKLELKEEIRELKRATKEGLDTENLSENVFYFCTVANNFIGNVGGLVWLTDRIADMPPKEKEMFLKAAYSFRDWASAFTANLERRM